MIALHAGIHTDYVGEVIGAWRVMFDELLKPK